MRHLSNFVKIVQTVVEIIAILRFSIMAAAAILDFRKFKFLPAGTCERPNLRHFVKFRQDRSTLPMYVTMSNFVKIGQTVAEIL